MSTQPQSLADIVAQASREDDFLSRKVFDEIKAAGANGRTLDELTQAITGKVRPLGSDTGPVAKALFRLTSQSKVRATGHFRQPTSYRAYFGAVCYELAGGEVWAVWGPGETMSRKGEPVRVVQLQGPPPPPARPLLVQEREEQPPRHGDGDLPLSMF